MSTPFETWWNKHTIDAKRTHSDAVVLWQGNGCPGECPKLSLGPEVRASAEAAWEASEIRMNIMRRTRGDNLGHRKSGPKLVMAWFVKNPDGSHWSEVSEGTGLSEVVIRTVVSRLTRIGRLERLNVGFYRLSPGYVPDVNSGLLVEDTPPVTEPVNGEVKCDDR